MYNGVLLKQNEQPTHQQLSKLSELAISFTGIVIFYTNDLKSTPSKLTLPSTSPEARFCCHAYTLYIAGQKIECCIANQRVDQLRSINPIRRREKRLGMAMFTWLIDIAITNSHTLLKTVRPAAVSGVELREFKRRLADSLTKLKKRTSRGASCNKKKAFCGTSKRRPNTGAQNVKGLSCECFIAFHHRAVLKNSPQLRASLEAVC
ncbi:hypothetical protein GQ600_6360 [Phytophthora cactorum]|nr:hypothetical protein GQ600_6360 [Phytophthora cactorum]